MLSSSTCAVVYQISSNVQLQASVQNAEINCRRLTLSNDANVIRQ